MKKLLIISVIALCGCQSKPQDSPEAIRIFNDRMTVLDSSIMFLTLKLSFDSIAQRCDADRHYKFTDRDNNIMKQLDSLGFKY